MCHTTSLIIVKALNVCIFSAGFLPAVLTSSLIETGNMLIMTYAYARASGDGGLIIRYVRQDSNFSLIGPKTRAVSIADFLGRLFDRFNAVHS